MARISFNKQMEEYLFDIIRTGEDGNIYRCLVLKSDNQKLKVREFRRLNNSTGGGPGVDPPDEDGEAEPHDDLLPIGVEDSLKVLCVQEVVTHFI